MNRHVNGAVEQLFFYLLGKEALVPDFGKGSVKYFIALCLYGFYVKGYPREYPCQGVLYRFSLGKGEFASPRTDYNFFHVIFCVHFSIHKKKRATNQVRNLYCIKKQEIVQEPCVCGSVSAPKARSHCRRPHKILAK